MPRTLRCDLHFVRLSMPKLLGGDFSTQVGPSVPEIFRGDLSPKWVHLCQRYLRVIFSPRSVHLCSRYFRGDLFTQVRPSVPEIFKCDFFTQVGPFVPGTICARDFNRGKKNVRFYLEAIIIVERLFCQLYLETCCCFPRFSLLFVSFCFDIFI